MISATWCRETKSVSCESMEARLISSFFPTSRGRAIPYCVFTTSAVSTEVVTAYTDYTTNRDIVASIERDMLQQASDVRSATEYSYRRGEASFVEFLDAVRAFNETMQSYHAAQADYARSLYTLESLAGEVRP